MEGSVIARTEAPKQSIFVVRRDFPADCADVRGSYSRNSWEFCDIKSGLIRDIRGKGLGLGRFNFPPAAFICSISLNLRFVAHAKN